jgi:hypothetical protein
MHGSMHRGDGEKGAGMKWRARVAVLLMFLLPLPLIWASSRVVGGWNATATREDGGRLVPILPPDETRRLLTFERACGRDEDCEAPLVCLRQLLWKRACVASTCATDADCSQGLSCYSIAVGDRVLRRCGAPGEVPVGEFCMELPRSRSMACAPDLMCTHKRCRRPCQPQEPQSCPEGYFCSAADVKGPVCLPTCEGRSCPEGQRCVALEHGISICALVMGTDCQLTPCPTGQRCEVAVKKSRNVVGMRCLLECDAQARPCPEGSSCLRERCIQSCNSDAPGTCGPLEKCSGMWKDNPGLCTFDFDK